MKFIKVTAAFRADHQPDFESLGIEVTDEDFEQVDWDDLFINPLDISHFYPTDTDTTNIVMIEGGKWTVKETPEEIKDQVDAIK